MAEDNTTLGVLDEDKETLPGFTLKYDIVLLVLATFIVIFNATVFMSMLHRKCLRLATNCFLAGLATCDFMTGLLGIPLFVACNSTYSFSTCAASAIFTQFTSVLTILHILLITADRYVSILYSMRYHELLTKNRTKKALAVVWGFSLGVPLLQLTWTDYNMDVTVEGDEEERKASLFFYIVCFITIFFVPFMWMVYAYARIFVAVHRQCERIKRENVPGSRNKATRGHQISHQSRAIIIYIVIFATHLLTWLPYHIFLFEELSRSNNFHLTLEMRYVFTYCRFSEALINPLLYTFGKKDLRKAVASDIHKIGEKIMCFLPSGETVNARQDIARYFEVTRDTVCVTPRLARTDLKIETLSFKYNPADSPSLSFQLSPSGKFSPF